MENFNGNGKLCMYHTNKRFVNGTQLGTMFHKINPSIPRVIINKNNIIRMTTLGGKRCFTPYIRMNKIKRSSWMRCTRRIWKLYWKLDSTEVLPRQPLLIKVDKRDPHRWPRRWCHMAKGVDDDATDDTSCRGSGSRKTMCPKHRLEEPLRRWPVPITLPVRRSWTKQDESSNPIKQFWSLICPTERRFMDNWGTKETLGTEKCGHWV